MAGGLLGSLRVRLTAETEDFRRGLDGARKNVASLEKDLSKFRNSTLANSLSLAGLVTGLGALIVSTANAADVIDKMSIRTGISRERLQELKYVADQIGVSFDGVAGAVAALTKRIPELETGSGASADAMRRIGVSVKDASGHLKGMGELFPQVITGLSKMQNETARNATATQIFGKKADELTPIIAAGGAEIERLSKRARDLGLVMNDTELNSLVSFQDRMSELKMQMEAAGRVIVVSLIPALEGLAPIVVKIAQGVGMAVKGWQMIGATLALIPLLASAAGTAMSGNIKAAGKEVDDAMTAWRESISEIEDPTIAITPKLDLKTGAGTTAAVGKFFDSLEAEWENLRHGVKLIGLEVGGTDPQKNAEEEAHQLNLLDIEKQHILARSKLNELTPFETSESLRQLAIKRQIVIATRTQTDLAQRDNVQTLATREFQDTLLTDQIEKERMLSGVAVLRLDAEESVGDKIKARLGLQLSLSQRVYELQRDALLADTTMQDTVRAAALLALDLARQREQVGLRTVAQAEAELAVIAKQRQLRDDIKSSAANLISSAFAGNLSAKEVGSTIFGLGAEGLGVKLGGALGASVGGPIGMAVASGLGGMLGGMFGDKKKQDEQQAPVIKGLDAIERAQRDTITSIAAQTDALLNPESRLVNLPSSFSIPKFDPFGNAGGSGNSVAQTNNITMNVTIASGDAKTVQDAITKAITDVLAGQRRSSAWGQNVLA